MKLNTFNSRKGTSQLWWIISAAVIAILALIFITIWFSSAGNKLFQGFDTTIGSLQDRDQDGVTDLLDKCPCDATIGNEYPSGRSTCGIVCLDSNKK